MSAFWTALLERVAPGVALSWRARSSIPAHCDRCRRGLTPAEVPNLFKHGFTSDGLTFTADRFLCARCFRRTPPDAQRRWIPLAQLFEE